MKSLGETSTVQKLGPYRLGLLLGEGGMGEVYKAFDDRLGRWVAVKRVRGEVTEKGRERFRHEARTLAQLGHPGIVQIFDLVEDDDGDCIVMELIDGPTLYELLREGPLAPQLVLDYGSQIVSALNAAHSGGVVHRDLKTENVMVLASGHIKVLDFGLAQRLSPPEDRTSPGGLIPENQDPSSGCIMGTPRVMSPEQALGGPMDARSDLFALGVLLYEISTARSPFKGRTPFETLRRVTTHVPPSVQRLNPRVPDGLSELIDCLLEKESVHRPRDAQAVEQALAAIRADDASTDSSLGPTGEQLPAIGQGSRGCKGDTTSRQKTIRGAYPSPEYQMEDARVVVTTLLMSDLVGSTQLVEKLGDREAAALFRRHDRAARDLLEAHNGREIDKTDGFLLLFDRPWSAVVYGLGYHQILKELGLKARVGIHLGEVVLHHNSETDVLRGAKPLEVEGLAKPTAARLMSLAIGGQTLLTRAAFEVVRRAAMNDAEQPLPSAASAMDRDLEWLAHGHYRFQGLGEDIEVFEVGVPGTAPLVAPAGSAKVQRVDERGATATGFQRLPLPVEMSRDQSVTLRSWPPPELPEQPYPVLLPYTHPDFLAGRDQEIAGLRRLLAMPVPVLGLSAPSGTGKSSLILGGLVPTLRMAGAPVAWVRYPAEIGVAAQLIGDLLVGVEPVDDSDSTGFVERLAEVERLSGLPPVLVLDQFEDVLREDAAEARRVLGVLMAASVVRRAGIAAPLCRWLIAYRRELYGQLQVWLGDVLADARASGVVGIEALPNDLSQAERFHSMSLRPLAAPTSGTSDPLGEATRIFQAAIEKPLEIDRGQGSILRSIEGAIEGGQGGLDWPWRFPPGHAERLARAFAETRLARPDAPLAPELQVVLAHLLAKSGPDGRVVVPEDPASLIDEALDNHLRRALEAVFPADTAESSTRRARALLALRELATSAGQRDEGLWPEELGRAIGGDGEAILEELATPVSRLVVVRESPDGLRCVLAHDRMAEAVVRLVEEEGGRGRLVIDTELLALRRFVALRTALYREGEGKASTRMSRRVFGRIEDNAAALLWDNERRRWFAACRARRQSDRSRLTGLTTLAVLVLALLGWGAWSWARRLAEHRALLEQVVRGEPDKAFQALGNLSTQPDADSAELLALLRRREVPMDVLEQGLGGLDGPVRSAAVLRAVEIVLPWVEENPENPVLLANLVWALDFAPGRDPFFAQRARALRDQVLEPLRRLRPPPFPGLKDPDWIQVPAGSFWMGIGPDEEGADSERPRHEVRISAFRMQRHEVTNADYRRLVPGHDPGSEDDLPANFVSWYAAYTYAAWLGGRLPTEAEWEYAARAGCRFPYCTREGLETSVDAVAWTVRNSLDVSAGELRPQPVMRLEPNPWGLFDMLGNVWEWTADGYGNYLEQPQTDPWRRTYAASSGNRTDRGGYFGGGAEWVRVSARAPGAPGDEDWIQGFRAVLPGSPES